VAVDLFAGIPVGDYEGALAWYERLLGSGPSFVPSATEAVWELAEHRSVFIEERPQHAGHAMHTIFVDNLDAHVQETAGGGIEPAERGNVLEWGAEGDVSRPGRQRDWFR
jgi:hypothetical protein